MPGVLGVPGSSDRGRTSSWALGSGVRTRGAEWVLGWQGLKSVAVRRGEHLGE